jgi:hypothetical protein
MKKFVLALIASLALMSAAQADPQATLIYGNQKDNTTHVLSDVLLFDLKTKIYQHTDIDLLVINKTAVGTNLVTNRVEAGVTLTYPLDNMFSVYIRPSVGSKQKSGTNSVNYYTSEQGLKLNLPYNFVAGVGYYYREAFDPLNKDAYQEMRYSIGYNITAQDKLAIGTFRYISGFNPSTTYWAGYTHSF